VVSLSLNRAISHIVPAFDSERGKVMKTTIEITQRNFRFKFMIFNRKDVIITN